MEKEFINLAKMIATLIEQDKAAQAFISSSEENRNKMIWAYADEAAKRIQRLQNMWLTNADFRRQFLLEVFRICKN